VKGNRWQQLQVELGIDKARLQQLSIFQQDGLPLLAA